MSYFNGISSKFTRLFIGIVTIDERIHTDNGGGTWSEISDNGLLKGDNQLDYYSGDSSGRHSHEWIDKDGNEGNHGYK